MVSDPFIDPSHSSFAATSAARWLSFPIGQTLSAEPYHAVCDDEAKTQRSLLHNVTRSGPTLTNETTVRFGVTVMTMNADHIERRNATKSDI